jgi:Tripartite tricarboxylate transporter family receptor
MYDKLNFNFIRDFAVIGMVRGPLVMVVHPFVPAKTLSEFIAYANGNPGKVSMGSAGIGGTGHERGTVSDSNRGEDDSRPLSRRSARNIRSARRSSAGSILWPARSNRPHSCRQLTRAGGDDDR